MHAPAQFCPPTEITELASRVSCQIGCYAAIRRSLSLAHRRVVGFRARRFRSAADSTRREACVGAVRSCVSEFRAGCSNSPLKRSPACPTLPCQEFPMGVGPQTPLGCFRDRPPAGTRRNIYADRRTRLRQTVLVPVHPLRSTRRSQGRGGSRPIALHTCQLLKPTVPYPDNSATTAAAY